MSDKERLYKHLETKTTLSFMEILPQAFDVFRKSAMPFILLVLFATAVFILAVLIGALNLILFLILSLVFVFVFLPGIQVGAGHYTYKLLNNQNVQFSDFLLGFKFNLQQLVLQAIIVTAIVLAVTILPNLNYYQDYFQMFLNAMEDPDNAMEMMTEFSESHKGFRMIEMLANLFSFYITIVLSIAPYLVSFFKVNAFTAIDLSVKSLNRVVFQAAFLRIMFGLFTVVGAVFFLVGLLVAIPIFLIGTFLIFYSLFGDLLPKNNDNQTDILNHLQ